MRVLVVSSFLHHRGGDSTCLLGLMEGLRDRGHEVIPFGMRHPDNLPSVWEGRFPPQVEVLSAEGADRVLGLARAIWSRRAARAIEGLLRDLRPDVAHVHHLHRHLTPAVLDPLRRAGVPVVWTVHDYELVCPAGTLWNRREGVCTRCVGGGVRHAVRLRCRRDDLAQSAAVALEKWLHARLGVLGKVDRFLCPSRFLADRLLEAGVPADRVSHLPNFVDVAPPGGAPGAGWVFAGRLSAEKGVDVLLDAARRLPHRALRVCGGGPELERLRRIAPPNVIFLGPLDPVAVGAELRGAGVVAVPSRWPENFPYAVLEAQMAGRAVVASRVGGIPEQITDGEDGVLVPPDDPALLAEAVEALLGDPARAARLGSRARARVIHERGREPWLDTVEAVYRGLP